MVEPVELQRNFFEMLLRSQYWPEERMVAYQRTQLDALLRHAREHTRFYAGRLGALFRPAGTIDWDRWTDVPILKRADLLASHRETLADKLPLGHGPTGEAKTSGSTGVPLRLRYTGITALTTQAIRWRLDSWYGLDWSKTLYIRHGYDALADWPMGVEQGPWGTALGRRRAARPLVQLNRRGTPEQQLEFMRRIGAVYAATGGPKQAHSIALEAERAGVDIRLGAVMTSGEDVTELDREVCRRVLGAEIVDVYSSQEGSHLAHRCPSGTCWHVNAETVLLEIVDDDGQPCAPGETGRVVITPFYATAQPLIRYDQGDLAVAGERCVCGRPLPVLTQLLGRVVHLFRHPDGRTVARFYGEDNRALLRAGPWQVAQIGPNDYEVRYVPLDWDAPGDETAAEAAFRKVYFDDANVRFSRVRAIQPLASGKYMEYVNEFSR